MGLFPGCAKPCGEAVSQASATCRFDEELSLSAVFSYFGSTRSAKLRFVPGGRTVSSLSAIRIARADAIASATLTVQTSGEGFFEITRELAGFLKSAKARDGVLLVFVRHTSASLVIQENADPDVRVDLVTALDRLAPADAGWVHDVEGPDDMPAHVKSMLNGVSLHVPVAGGALRLGTWQGVYVAEHRRAPHRREVIVQFIGSCGPD
jgi:secondary thiamine-phosphate synthase enzyme